MTRRAQDLLRSAGLLALLAAPAAAQHPNHARGFRPEHTFELGGIENVNLFNGNLNLTIPLGGTYPLGPSFSYGFVLTYSGNVWQWDETTDGDSDGNLAYLQADPRATDNAGLGWTVSFGRYLSVQDPDNTTMEPQWIGPDQAPHRLHTGRLHPTGQFFGTNWLFSQDGTYMRYDVGGSELEMPDGTEHVFGPHGPTRIEDAFGHGLSIEYLQADPAGDPRLWEITDDHGRVHRVRFGKAHGRLMVSKVELDTFTGITGHYTFSYDTSTSIPRACNHPVYCAGGDGVCGNTSNVTVPLLTQVALPDGSAYSMPVGAYHVGETASCPNPSRTINGHLERLDLPTGGAYEWDWDLFSFPVESARPEDSPPGTPPAVPYTTSVGVAERRHRNRSDGQLGNWTYERDLTSFGDGFGQRELVVTETVAPGEDVTKHYFSVWAHPDSDPKPSGGWTDDEYGLPFTRAVTDGSSPGRYLSRQVYDGGTSLVRSQYVRYERSGSTAANPRLVSQRTTYPGGKRADVDYSSFDGLGHYRTMTTAGNFSGQNARTVTTNYNPGSSITSIPSTGDPWILGTYDLTTTTEGGQTVTREYDFDHFTGFLFRVRTRKGASRSADDVVLVRTRKHHTDPHTGFLAREDFYGGDGAGLPTNAHVSDLDLSGASVVYQRRHDYTCGVLWRSQWLEAGGGALLSSPDLDVDCDSGLVERSRDTAGLQVTYDYDAMGRLVGVDLPAGEGADTSYQYDLEGTSGNLPARVTIQEKDGSTVLTEGQVRFDGFGRVAEERRKMPDGTFAVRKTLWSSRGWVENRSEWQAENDGANSVTQFRQYDPFGRPGRITLPDGHQVTLSYSGESSRTISVPVATGVLNGEPTYTSASTTETYDRFGRLFQVHEPNGVETTYAYDALDNLVQVRMNTTGSPIQTRSFGYDHNGFLRSEGHPELGTSVVYSAYDPLGHPGRVQRGGWDLAYGYDRAGRLLEIRDHGTSGETGLWKEWSYATANFQAGKWSNGKLETAVRHNRVYRPGTATEITVPVTETYAYDGVGGRISGVTTTMGTGKEEDNTVPTFDYGLDYDALGNVTSRSYPDCSHLHCKDKSPDRNVGAAYTQGLLTAVGGYASSISYHPNGLVHRVAHTNGVTDVQENDPDDLRRPLRLRTTGASLDLDTGRFDYDGAGNVSKMGSSFFQYDLLSRLTEAEVALVPDSCTQDLHVQSVTYSAFGTEEVCGEITTGPGVTIDPSGDVTFRAGERIVLGSGFRVDSGGRFVAEIDPGFEPSGGSEATWEGSYDRFGNLLSVATQKPGGSKITRTMGVNAGTNRLSVASYDTSGNVTSWSGRSSRYDPFNMLRETGTYVFLYGPGDERIWTIDWSQGSAVTSWIETWTLRDLDGTPLRQLKTTGGNNQSANWTFERDYVWRDGGLLAAVTPNGTEHFHLDHLGTPRLVTRFGGNVLAHHSYFPFGEEATSPADATVPLQYTGHERDDLDPGGTTRDLDYMHARYFSAHLGRFQSVDPVGGSPNWPQTWNLYSYTLGNPLKYTDPEGLFPFFPLGEIPFFFDEITVNAQALALTARAFNPFTGVAGLGSLIFGRGFLNGLQGTGDSLAALAGWATGQLPRTGVATPEMTAQLASTPGMNNIRQEYRRRGCEDGDYSTDFQYRELITTTNATGQLVGGFVANITSAGGGMIVVNAQNTWGLESATRFPGVGNRDNASIQQMLSGSGSFEYPKSILEDRAYGPMGKATLHYIWAEPSPCN